MFKRILYTSLVDVSLPYGPGVNERVFLKDMVRRYGKNLCAVIPMPQLGLPEELEDLATVMIPAPGSVRSGQGWLAGRTVGTSILPQVIARFRPDLSIMRFASFALPHFIAFGRNRVRYVIRAPGEVTFGKFYANNPFARPLDYVNTRVAEKLWRGAMLIDVVTEQKRQELIERYPELSGRVHVIDNAVDTDDFSGVIPEQVRRALGFEPEEVVIGFVGNFPMRRGAREVLEAVRAMKSYYPVRGLIVGDGGDADSCRDLAERYGIASLVRVHGQAAYREVPRLMAAMDIGLSILRPDERAASEQKVRQYLATGLCVVGTAGSNDFLRGEPFARVVDTHDTDEVVAAARSFVEMGRDRVMGLGRKAREFAQARLSVVVKNDERLGLWQEAWRRGQ